VSDGQKKRKKYIEMFSSFTESFNSKLWIIVCSLVYWVTEGHPARKKTECWFVGDDDVLSFAHLIVPVVTSTSIIVSSSKM